QLDDRAGAVAAAVAHDELAPAGAARVRAQHPLAVAPAELAVVHREPGPRAVQLVGRVRQLAVEADVLEAVHPPVAVEDPRADAPAVLREEQDPPVEHLLA